ncbi:SCO family protein [Nitrosomonas sp. JL21]|uniref:SCO family protein n=1 Tax=Nitrosomonas sp. JL21 TaxID=153949 RepID=UPI0013713B63|nr:SCO family protein [Nitrosomonas sp. JL21]MCC7090758.1 SCO family protein [Nitrosomonas sp.]MXS78935.1 SCO family protein [Nitrosomonas sp. JL21]
MKKIAVMLLFGLFESMLMADYAAAGESTVDERLERARNYFGDERLIDQNGVAHRFVSDLLSNHVVLINVIFTNCQDACPMQTQKLQWVRRELGEYFGSRILFLSLSVDPKRDSPALLKAFADKQQANVDGWKFLTAEETVMARVLGRLNQWSDDPNNHSTMLIAGNARSAHWVKLRPDSPPERIVADLRRLADIGN